MSKKINRTTAILNEISKSTTAEAILRQQPTDEQVNAAIDANHNDGADEVIDAVAVESNGHAFRNADDASRKGPYASEELARLTPYRNKGPKQWELYEVTVPTACVNMFIRRDLGNVPVPAVEAKVITVYVWEVNHTHAIALVARKMGFDAGIAGSKMRQPGLKTENASLKSELEALKAKLAAAGLS